MSKFTTALIDLDSMLHIVAAVQFKAGNHDRPGVVKGHVKRFISTIRKNSLCKDAIMFYQKEGHTNFRNTILPSYKGHRKTSDAIACWKSTILEAFAEEKAIGLQHLESDDAISVVADHLGNKGIVIVSGDKDMAQVKGTHYNPFKPNLEPEERWYSQSYILADRFFWEQVLCGDSTDMPSSHCGIQGMGPKGAAKALSDDNGYRKNIQDAYTAKYGAVEGRERASCTFKMVRLLRKYGNEYINKDATEELEALVKGYESYREPIINSITNLFPTKSNKAMDAKLLFKK